VLYCAGGQKFFYRTGDFMEELKDKRSKLLETWLSLVLESEETGRFAKKLNMDPFTNPVHWNLRESLETLLTVLFSGENKEYLNKYSDKHLNKKNESVSAEEKKLRQALDDVLRLRAVQSVKPGQAIAFLFSLKEILKKEQGATGKPGAQAELDRIYHLIDQVILVGFDIYIECREQLFAIKIDEYRRNPYPDFDASLSCSSKSVTGTSAEEKKCS
jgi:hypothetical protein